MKVFDLCCCQTQTTDFCLSNQKPNQVMTGFWHLPSLPMFDELKPVNPDFVTQIWDGKRHYTTSTRIPPSFSFEPPQISDNLDIFFSCSYSQWGIVPRLGPSASHWKRYNSHHLVTSRRKDRKISKDRMKGMKGMGEPGTVHVKFHPFICPQICPNTSIIHHNSMSQISLTRPWGLTFQSHFPVCYGLMAISSHYPPPSKQKPFNPIFQQKHQTFWVSKQVKEDGGNFHLG